MVEFLIDMNPDWILQYRHDTLTNFFKVFPALKSDYIYIFVIALDSVVTRCLTKEQGI